MTPPADRMPTREIITLPDGYEASVYIHAPSRETPEAGAVIYFHGIQSHAGWYYGSSIALADAGYTVYQVNRRGSGDNMVDRGHADSSTQLLEDIDAAGRFVADRSGGELHYLGVSWGGKLLAAYATWGARKGPGIASLTLLAPGIVAKISPGFFKKLGIAASILFNPRKEFEIPLSDPALFTDTPAMQEYLRNDRNTLHKATAKLMLVSRTLDDRIKKVPRDSLNVPVTLVLASKDRIIDNEKTIETVKRIAGEHLHTETLEGCHTLEFEEDPSPLYRVLKEAMLRGK